MKTRLDFLLLIIGLFVLVSCTGQSNNHKDWDTSNPELTGLRSDLFQKLSNDLQTNKFPNTHAVLVIKDKKIIFEEYLNGFNKNKRQYTASVSKSAGSILTGVAMQEGIIDDVGSGILDKPAYELFPAYKSNILAEPAKAKILYRHILAMTGGLQWDEASYPYNDARNDWVAARESNDPIRYLLAKDLVEEPGAQFKYNGGYCVMLSYQIQKETGKSVLDYAKEKLFRPLDIQSFEWETLRSGLTDTDGGLHLRPRDMAKLGQLYLNNGNWNGAQIVSEKWIKASTKEQIINEGMPNYGFQWWCGDFHYKGKSAYTYFASGHGGQKIYVFPDFNAVIVITHQVFNNNFGELNNMKMLSNYILPALDNLPEMQSEINLSQEVLEDYAGIYSRGQDAFEVKLKNGALLLIEPGRPDLKLIPTSEHQFKAITPEGFEVQVLFTSNDEGTAEKIELYFSFQEWQYFKV